MTESAGPSPEELIERIRDLRHSDIRAEEDPCVCALDQVRATLYVRFDSQKSEFMTTQCNEQTVPRRRGCSEHPDGFQPTHKTAALLTLAQFNEAEGAVSQSCARVISSTALLTAGPMRSMWVCSPGTPGRLRTERFSWQTNLVFRDEAATEKQVASSSASLACIPSHHRPQSWPIPRNLVTGKGVAERWRVKAIHKPV